MRNQDTKIIKDEDYLCKKIWKIMIKKIIITLVFFSLLTSISCKDSSEEAEEITTKDGNYPEMTFDKKEHDFGVLIEGDKLETVFSFKKSGCNSYFIIIRISFLLQFINNN